MRGKLRVDTDEQGGDGLDFGGKERTSRRRTEARTSRSKKRTGTTMMNSRRERRTRRRKKKKQGEDEVVSDGGGGVVAVSEVVTRWTGGGRPPSGRSVSNRAPSGGGSSSSAGTQRFGHGANSNSSARNTDWAAEDYLMTGELSAAPPNPASGNRRNPTWRSAGRSPVEGAMSETLKRKSQIDAKKIKLLEVMARNKAERSGGGSGPGVDSAREDRELKLAEEQHKETTRARANADVTNMASMEIISREQMKTIFFANLPDESKLALKNLEPNKDGSDKESN